METFCENRKMAVFGLILAMFLTSQSCDFDAFAHAGAPFGRRMTAKFYGNRMDSFGEI